MLSQEARIFFKGWLKNPRSVGIPVPSSKFLARAMAEKLPVTPDEYVLELGAGTGVVTKALLDTGLAPEKLVIIERDQNFIDKLKHDFPGLTLIRGDARHLPELLEERNIPGIAAVVSSLPLLNMPVPLRHSILKSAFSVLKPDGVYVQYTYGFVSPVPPQYQHMIGVKGRISSYIWRNVPPARVWRYKRDAARQREHA